MESETDLQTAISNAMRLRLTDFRNQADSLTPEGVRRLLEKDLGLETFSLDSHKRFIKQCLHECLHDFAAKDSSKDLGEGTDEISENRASPTDKGDAQCASLACEGEPDAPTILLEEEAVDEDLKVELDGKKSGGVINEDIIHDSIHKRAAYFKAHSETITYLGARRLLEEDLQLNKFALDAYKNVVREKLNEVLDSVAESASKSKTSHPAKISSGKESIKEPRKLKDKDLKSSGSDDTDNELEDVVVKQTKEKSSKFEKKRKSKSEALKASKKSRSTNKLAEPKLTKQNSAAKQDGESSSGYTSQSSHENHVKESSHKSSLGHGRKAEHLKNIIRSCGMCVPPSVYKRVKQAPESKQEANLIKELEYILRREGLSSNPSEKEIKEVRTKKERTKELEGIDMTNIISGSRRTRTNSFIPPKPKISVENDDDSDEEDTEDGVTDSEENSNASNEDDGEEESE